MDLSFNFNGEVEIKKLDIMRIAPQLSIIDIKFKKISCFRIKLSFKLLNIKKWSDAMINEIKTRKGQIFFSLFIWS